MAATDDRAPTFGKPTQPQWQFRLFARRSIRLGVLAVVLSLVGMAIFYQLVVVPTLTATSARIWVAGSDDRLVVHVDDEHDRASISGGTNGLSRLIIDRDSLFVPADEVGAGGLGFEWLEVPNSAFDREVKLPTVDEIGRSLSRGAKDCGATNTDAEFLFALFLGIDTNVDGVSLCDAAVGAAADDGNDLLVKSGAVRPSALGVIPPTAVG
ncbi:MAG: hypothetical protein ABMA25_09715, partial [Ilumatobacteraceae bacterium]